ncbi:MAG TPA: signal peptidase II [Clostridiales bacterium]|nr:signal peptidase II [Clostridiales bacterium]
MNGNEENIDYKAKTKAFLADWTQVAKKKWWLYIVELAVIAVILIADLLSKKYVWNFVDQNGVQENVIGLFNLVKVKNEGAGFGIFQGKTIGLTIITFIVVIAICVYLFFALKETEWLRISLVFITAGGIGNIVDRIAFGYVRDFIQFSFWDSFPVFNIADSFVTVGAFMLVVVLIVMLVKEGKKNQKEFEEEQKNVASNEHEQIDPLDAPINLNPMMKSQNDYSFVVSEKKDEKVEQNDVKNTEENTQNSAENSQKSAENSNDIPQNDTQNQVESTSENTDGEKNADKE